MQGGINVGSGINAAIAVLRGGVRVLSVPEIALVTVQVIKNRDLREYAFVFNALRSEALRAWKSTICEYRCCASEDKA
jgi:hypothetical protein